MDYWKHSLLSQRKFGGQPNDYVAIHEFLDSSKLFMFNLKHRLLLHNTFGIELCIELFGSLIVNSDNKTVLTRDIAAEHCKEDLSGVVPTLNDWFGVYDETLLHTIDTPLIADAALYQFVMRPLLRSGLRATLMITWSNFGVYLVEKFLGTEKAVLFANCLGEVKDVRTYLQAVKMNQRWQYSPDKNEIKWLNSQENGELQSNSHQRVVE